MTDLQLITLYLIKLLKSMRPKRNVSDSYPRTVTA